MRPAGFERARFVLSERAMDQGWWLLHLRAQIASIRTDAEYWRRRGRFQTAAELSRVAAFVEEATDHRERLHRLPAAITADRKAVQRPDSRRSHKVEPSR